MSGGRKEREVGGLLIESTDVKSVLWYATDEGVRVRIFGDAGLLVAGVITRSNSRIVEVESEGTFYYIPIKAVKMVAYTPPGKRME